MRKIKYLNIGIVAICLITLLAGCLFFDPFVLVNNWRITPQQATGTEVNLSFVTGSEMEFAFTIKNLGEERNLYASNFDVVCVISGSEESSTAIYFDSPLITSINFAEEESKNITLHALTKSSFANSSKILVKYDGTTICEYIVRN